MRGLNVPGSSQPLLRRMVVDLPNVSRSEDLGGASFLRAGGKKAERRASAEKAAVPNQPWPSSRLSAGLRQAFRQGLDTDINIQTWRHAAIAISRRHLCQAKFKRDFIEAVSWAWNDEMAAHSTKVAGLTYARGLEEAPGHVTSAKAEYRRICREWHAWLGLSGYRGRKGGQEEGKGGGAPG